MKLTMNRIGVVFTGLIMFCALSFAQLRHPSQPKNPLRKRNLPCHLRWAYQQSMTEAPTLPSERLKLDL